MIRYLLICLFFALTSCQYNPFAHRFLTREPTPEEVVGKYQLKEVYVDMVDPGLGKRIRSLPIAPTITLNANRSATLINFPVIEEQEGAFNYQFRGFENFTAYWEISAVGGVSSGGEYKTVYGLRLTLSNGRVLFDSPSLTGNGAVDGMIFTLYDGDQGQILGYIKAEI